MKYIKKTIEDGESSQRNSSQEEEVCFGLSDLTNASASAEFVLCFKADKLYNKKNIKSRGIIRKFYLFIYYFKKIKNKRY